MISMAAWVLLHLVVFWHDFCSSPSVVEGVEIRGDGDDGGIFGCCEGLRCVRGVGVKIYLLSTPCFRACVFLILCCGNVCRSPISVLYPCSLCLSSSTGVWLILYKSFIIGLEPIGLLIHFWATIYCSFLTPATNWLVSE